MTSRLVEMVARTIEPLGLRVDRALARRTRVLDRIPTVVNRRGGKRSYAEWAWVIGLLQALMTELLDGVDQPNVVDVGCGTGLVLIAAEPSVADGGRLTGLDIQTSAIEFCRRHYPDPPFRFAELPMSHPVYAPDGVTGPGDRQARAEGTKDGGWPVDTASADLVTALSVLTHLDRQAALALLGEAARALRPGAAALVSVFLVDPADGGHGPEAGATASRFHRTDPAAWRFDRPLGDGWYAPLWADPPERAIGLTRAALDELAAEVRLTVERVIPGTWRERRGLYFQDLIILRSSLS